MIPIAISEEVKIYCPREGKFSFFNSPYPSHHIYSSIDIYPVKNFNAVAPSPVKGEIVDVRKVKCPPGKGFRSSVYDYVILMRSLENPERWIKILHVKPSVRKGEIVRPGEKLGKFIRSGFFDFWTDPHIHVEVRKPSDHIRALGGFKFKRLIMTKCEVSECGTLSGVVTKSKDEYSLVKLNEEYKYGIPVNVGGELGVLDGGIPHYGLFGVHMPMQLRLRIKKTVKLCGKKIGEVKSVYSNMCIAQISSLTFKLNKIPVRLSFYFYPLINPLVKVIPHKPGKLKLEESEEIHITISKIETCSIH